MTDKQPEALRIAEWFEGGYGGCEYEAAAELRRLHEENQQWQDKCQAYIDLHDSVVKDSDRLYALNAELVKALHEANDAIAEWGAYASAYFQTKYDLQGDIDKAEEALAKAEGK